MLEAPRNIEAERAVVQSIFLEPDSIHHVAEFLRPDDFSSELYRMIYGEMLALFIAQQPISLTAIVDRLQGRAAGDIVAALTDTVPDFAHVAQYGHIVRDKAILRRTMDTCRQSATEACQPQADARAVLDSAMSGLAALADEETPGEFVSAPEALKASLTDLEKAHDAGSRFLRGVPTGWASMDGRTNGLRAGDLCYVAGRPGMGKTAFALCMAVNMARAGTRVAFFSLEMSREQLMFRLISQEANIGLSRIMGCQLAPRDFALIAEATGRLEALPLWIDDAPRLDLMGLRAKLRKFSRTHGAPNIVMIDYIQYMHDSGRHEKRYLELAAISRGLKCLAKELSIPAVVLAQLNRPEKGIKDPRPHLADLRESGNLEQDADLVVLIHRREEYMRRDDAEIEKFRGKAEIIIAKQRQGPTGAWDMAFDKDFTQFRDLESRY